MSNSGCVYQWVTWPVSLPWQRGSGVPRPFLSNGGLYDRQPWGHRGCSEEGGHDRTWGNYHPTGRERTVTTITWYVSLFFIVVLWLSCDCHVIYMCAVWVKQCVVWYSRATRRLTEQELTPAWSWWHLSTMIPPYRTYLTTENLSLSSRSEAMPYCCYQLLSYADVFEVLVHQAKPCFLHIQKKTHVFALSSLADLVHAL